MSVSYAEEGITTNAGAITINIYYSGKKGNAKNWTLPNIYSAVANAHPSLNYSNMNNITVYQLIDSFQRTVVNKKFEMAAHSVSVWGDEKKQFDDSLWYKNIYDKDDLFDE